MRTHTSSILLVIFSAFGLLSCTQSTKNDMARMGDSAAHTVGDAASTVGDVASGAVSGIGKTVTDTGRAIFGSDDILEARRQIDARASEGLQRLFASNPRARALYEKSYGYAVFDSRKISILLTTGNGTGVAVDKRSGQRTYMRMLTGGAGFGFGAQFFQIVHLFENRASMESFKRTGIEANAAASAVFGKDSLEQNIRFVNGLASFQLNEAGIMAAANLTGTKYWISEELNGPVTR